jgi:hypothetical protein
VIIDPLGVNAYHRAKMEELRRRIRKNVSPLLGNHNVYLRRGTRGDSRNPTNEAEIESVLSDYGFHFVEPERLTLDASVASILDARLVVGVNPTTPGCIRARVSSIAATSGSTMAVTAARPGRRAIAHACCRAIWPAPRIPTRSKETGVVAGENTARVHRSSFSLKVGRDQLLRTIRTKVV